MSRDFVTDSHQQTFQQSKRRCAFFTSATQPER